MLAALALAGPAAAASDPAAEVQADYRPDHKIDPCRHSQRDLETTKQLIPPDIEQYAPDFAEALDEALEARARGDCDQKQAPAPPTSSATPTPTPRPEVDRAKPTQTVVDPPPRPDPVTKRADDGSVKRVAAAEPDNAAPAPVVWILVLTGVLAAVLITLTVLRLTGWGETRTATMRHAWGEAAWRVSGAWHDFLDFVRLGR